MDSIWQDVRVAVRLYIRKPLFAIVVLVILGLAIGVNSAIFSVVNAVLLRPLEYPRAAELVAVVQVAADTQSRRPISPPNYFDLRDEIRAFSGVAAYWSPSINISGADGEPEKVLAATCSSALFGVLGVRPGAGRGFVAADEVPGAARVVILGHGLWKRRFGGDAAAIGRELMLDGAPALIVGVMPPGFAFPAAGTELWTPLRLSRTQPPNPAIRPEAYRQYQILSVVARVGAGATIEQSRSELVALGRRLEREHPDANRGTGFTAVPLQDTVVGAIRPALLLLLGAVGCVLLIACANVGSLMLVRAAGRAREVTIRMALGADRARLVRQMLTESLVLALAGGIVALVVSAWTLDLLVRFAPGGHSAARRGAHRRRRRRVHVPDRGRRRPALRRGAGVPGPHAPAARCAAGIGPRPGVRFAPARPAAAGRGANRAVADAAGRRGAARPELRAAAARRRRLPRVIGRDGRPHRAAARRGRRRPRAPRSSRGWSRRLRETRGSSPPA